MIDYIDRHKQEFGVEPICRVLRQADDTVERRTGDHTRPPADPLLGRARAGPAQQHQRKALMTTALDTATRPEYLPRGIEITSDPTYLAAIAAEINDGPVRSMTGRSRARYSPNSSM